MTCLFQGRLEPQNLPEMFKNANQFAVNGGHFLQAQGSAPVVYQYHYDISLIRLEDGTKIVGYLSLFYHVKRPSDTISTLGCYHVDLRHTGFFVVP